MTLIALHPDDLHFIVTYDPDRERVASRRDVVAVLEEIQALINDGADQTFTTVCPGCRADQIAAEASA